MARWVILKDNYVINVIEWDGATQYSYPYPHDSIKQDVEGIVNIGDWYETTEDVFYRPTQTPPDFPTQ